MPSYKALLLAGLILAGCQQVDTGRVHSLLDERDAAISNQDISAYSALIAADYRDGGKSKVEVMANIIALFDSFDTSSMRSFDREVRIIDDTHAECLQSYALEVTLDGESRRIVDREHLQFIYVNGDWKISGGLL